MGSIRFLLAIAVIIAHTSSVFGFGLVGGEMAVKLFFIISGFYMALILNEKYVGKNGGFWLFFKNRLLRLYPLYFLILLLTVVGAYVGYSLNPSVVSPYTQFLTYGDNLSLLSWVYLIFINGIMFGMDSSLFFEINTHTGALLFTPDFLNSELKVHTFLFVPQAWSISIELMFYLIAPFIVRKLKRLLLIMCASLITALILYFTNLPNDPWNYRFFPTQILYFVIGSIGYFIYTRINSGKLNISTQKKWIFFILSLSVILIYSFVETHVNSFFLSTSTVLIFSLSIPFIFDLTKKWKLDRFIGELSYSIYMVHILVIYLINLTGITRVFIFGLSELSVGITVILSIIIHYFFLEKIERYRQLNTQS